jgi:hypothetical protein
MDSFITPGPPRSLSEATPRAFRSARISAGTQDAFVRYNGLLAMAAAAAPASASGNPAPVAIHAMPALGNASLYTPTAVR